MVRLDRSRESYYLWQLLSPTKILGSLGRHASRYVSTISLLPCRSLTANSTWIRFVTRFILSPAFKLNRASYEEAIVQVIHSLEKLVNSKSQFAFSQAISSSTSPISPGSLTVRSFHHTRQVNLTARPLRFPRSYHTPLQRLYQTFPWPLHYFCS